MSSIVSSELPKRSPVWGITAVIRDSCRRCGAEWTPPSGYPNIAECQHPDVRRSEPPDCSRFFKKRWAGAAAASRPSRPDHRSSKPEAKEGSGVEKPGFPSAACAAKPAAGGVHGSNGASSSNDHLDDALLRGPRTGQNICTDRECENADWRG